MPESKAASNQSRTDQGGEQVVELPLAVQVQRAAMSLSPDTAATGPVNWPKKRQCRLLSVTWTMMPPRSSW